MTETCTIADLLHIIFVITDVITFYLYASVYTHVWFLNFIFFKNKCITETVQKFK